MKNFACIVIGTSSGGMNALTKLFKAIPVDYDKPVLVVQHKHKIQDNYYISYYNGFVNIPVLEAAEKADIIDGEIYFAPANYHLLVEENKTLALSIDEKVNYSRPSIDVLFESAAEVYKEKLIGVVLTGANNDGAAGLQTIKNNGGFTIVQKPEDADFSAMPLAAIDLMNPDFIGTLDEIAQKLFNYEL